jgi:site-specific DNA-methyltransferase (adenine-specific)
VIHDGSPPILAAFPVTASGSPATKRASGSDQEGNQGAAFGAESRPAGTVMIGYGDEGSAARFFYCAKASRAEREAGLAGSTLVGHDTRGGRIRNTHPTVKPLALMRYLTRLVCPRGGLVLDPFTGSGSTGRAALIEGFRFLGIERDPAFGEIARERLRTARDDAEEEP